MRKKHSLFFWLFMCFFVYALSTWFIPLLEISSGETYDAVPLGFFGLLYFPANAIVSTAVMGLYFLAIGGFYGVMSKVGAYSKLVDNIVKGLKGKEKTFLVLTAIILTVLNAVLGLPFAHMIIIPLIAGIVLKLGYNKLTALTVSVGPVLVGNLGSVFGSQIVGYLNTAFGLGVGTNLVWRIVLFVLVTTLFIFFVLKTGNLEEKKVVKKATKSSKNAKNTKAEVKEDDVLEEKEEILFLNNDTKSKKSATPIVIIFSLLFVFSVISTFNWSFFKVTIFDNIFELMSKVTLSSFGFDIKAGSYASNFDEVSIVTSIFGVLSPFGNWYLVEVIVLLIVAAMLVGWAYSVKFVEVFDGFVDGAKKMIKPAFCVCLANLILVPALSYYGKYAYYFIAEKLLGEGFNALSTFVSSLHASFLYNDFYYLAQEMFTVFSGLGYAAEHYPIITFIIQATYGLTMFIFPMSVVLVAGLTVLDVSYKEWIKHIWKFLLELFIVVLILIVVYSIGLNVIF